jgi:hypothetical protein
MENTVTVKKNTKEAPVELSPVLDILLGDETRRVKMTFGLLNRLALGSGGSEGLELLFTDAEIQERMLLEVLAERDEDGRVTRLTNLDVYDLSSEEGLKILNWAVEHLMDFFVRLSKTAQKLEGQYSPKPPISPTSSSTGSEI